MPPLRNVLGTAYYTVLCSSKPERPGKQQFLGEA